MCPVPLRRDSSTAPPAVDDIASQDIDAALTVLRGIPTVSGTSAMRKLTVQGGDRPLWRDNIRSRDALAARAVERRSALPTRHVARLSTEVTRAVAAWCSTPIASSAATRCRPTSTSTRPTTPPRPWFSASSPRPVIPVQSRRHRGDRGSDGYFRWCAALLKREQSAGERARGRGPDGGSGAVRSNVITRLPSCPYEAQ